MPLPLVLLTRTIAEVPVTGTQHPCGGTTSQVKALVSLQNFRAIVMFDATSGVGVYRPTEFLLMLQGRT